MYVFFLLDFRYLVFIFRVIGE